MSRPLLALLGCGLAGCAAAPPGPPPAAAGVPPPGPAALVTWSPMRQAFAELSSGVATEVRKRLRGRSVDQARTDRAPEALSRLWGRDRLVARAVWKMRQELSAEELAQVSAFLSSPLSARILRLATGPVDEEQAAAYTRSLEGDDPRVDRCARLIAGTGMIEITDLMAAVPILSAMQIANALTAEKERASAAEVARAAKAEIEASLPPDREGLAGGMILVVAHSLREVSDAELDQALAFWDSGLAARYRAALLDGFVLAAQVSTGQTLQAVSGEPVTLPPGLEGIDSAK